MLHLDFKGRQGNSVTSATEKKKSAAPDAVARFFFIFRSK